MIERPHYSYHISSCLQSYGPVNPFQPPTHRVIASLRPPYIGLTSVRQKHGIEVTTRIGTLLSQKSLHDPGIATKTKDKVAVSTATDPHGSSRVDTYSRMRISYIQL